MQLGVTVLGEQRTPGRYKLGEQHVSGHRSEKHLRSHRECVTEASSDNTWPWHYAGKSIGRDVLCALRKAHQRQKEMCQAVWVKYQYTVHAFACLYLDFLLNKKSSDSQGVLTAPQPPPLEMNGEALETLWLWLVLVTYEGGSCSHAALPEARQETGFTEHQKQPLGKGHVSYP